MNDWKKDLQKNHGGGYQGNQGNRNYNSPRESSYGLPKGYLEGGYFDQEGYLKDKLITDAASDVAKGFGKEMSNSQLRRFYGHVKTAEKAYSYSKDTKKLINDVSLILSFAAEAKGKEKVPSVFYDFIHKNIQNIKTAKDILKGFIPHFQAVVAYFTYHYPGSK